MLKCTGLYVLSDFFLILKFLKILVRNMGVCHERERILNVHLLDDGLAHRRRSSGEGCKLPTGAVVKSHGIERVRKRLIKISQV